MTSAWTDDKALAQWVVETCLLFGTTVETAHTVAAMFIEVLKNETEGPSCKSTTRSASKRI